jgi:hypothetical protein
MARTKRLPRTITGNEPGNFALTLDELASHIAEQPSVLRKKAVAGKFPGAYRTCGGAGEWRFPMSSVNLYQRANSVTK